MNPWLFILLINLSLFFLLIEWKSFKINVLGGIIAAVYQVIQNFILSRVDLFKYNNVNIGLPSYNIFSNEVNIFSIGVAFIIGTLIFQSIPRNIYLQLVNVIVWDLFFIMFRAITIFFNLVVITNASIFLFGHAVLILTFSLTWIKASFFSKYLIGDKNVKTNIS